jgi:hypothetical protein
MAGCENHLAGPVGAAGSEISDAVNNETVHGGMRSRNGPWGVAAEEAQIFTGIDAEFCLLVPLAGGARGSMRGSSAQTD